MRIKSKTIEHAYEATGDRGAARLVRELDQEIEYLQKAFAEVSEVVADDDETLMDAMLEVFGDDDLRESFYQWLRDVTGAEAA